MAAKWCLLLVLLTVVTQSLSLAENKCDDENNIATPTQQLVFLGDTVCMCCNLSQSPNRSSDDLHNIRFYQVDHLIMNVVKNWTTTDTICIETRVTDITDGWAIYYCFLETNDTNRCLGHTEVIYENTPDVSQAPYCILQHGTLSCVVRNARNGLLDPDKAEFFMQYYTSDDYKWNCSLTCDREVCNCSLVKGKDFLQDKKYHVTLSVIYTLNDKTTKTFASNSSLTPSDVVKWDPPELNILMKSARCLELSWKTVSTCENYSLQFTFTSHRHLRPAVQEFYNWNLNSSKRLCGLIPFTVYNISLKVRPTSSKVWSESAVQSVATLATVPDGSPQIAPGFARLDNNMADFFWKSLPENRFNGPGLRYLAIMNYWMSRFNSTDLILDQKFQPPGWKRLETPQDHVTFNVDDLQPGHNSTIHVVACNEEGCSKEMSSLHIDLLQVKQAPTEVIAIVVKNGSKEILNITWSPYSVAHAQSSSVLWCWYDQVQNSCRGEVKWVTVGPSVTSYVVETDNAMIDQSSKYITSQIMYGVSLQYLKGDFNVTSGFRWNTCIREINEDGSTVSHNCKDTLDHKRSYDKNAIYTTLTIPAAFVSVVILGVIISCFCKRFRKKMALFNKSNWPLPVKPNISPEDNIRRGEDAFICNLPESDCTELNQSQIISSVEATPLLDNQSRRESDCTELNQSQIISSVEATPLLDNQSRRESDCTELNQSQIISSVEATPLLDKQSRRESDCTELNQSHIISSVEAAPRRHIQSRKESGYIEDHECQTSSNTASKPPQPMNNLNYVEHHQWFSKPNPSPQNLHYSFVSPSSARFLSPNQNVVVADVHELCPSVSSTGENLNQTSTGENLNQTSTGENFNQTSNGENFNHTSNGENFIQICGGEYLKQTSAGENLTHTSAGENLKQATTGENFNHTSAGENLNQTSTGRNHIQTSPGEDLNQTSAGENLNQTSVGDNLKQTSVGENLKQTSVGYILNQTSAGDNLKQTSVGDNLNQTSAGENLKQTSAGKNLNHTSAGENVNQTSTFENFNQTSADENIKQTSPSENFNQTSADGNLNQTSTGQNHIQTSAGENLNQTSVGENLNLTSAGDNFNQTFAGENLNQTSTVENLSHTSSDENFNQTSAGDNLNQTSTGEHLNQTSDKRFLNQSICVKNFGIAYSDDNSSLLPQFQTYHHLFIKNPSASAQNHNSHPICIELQCNSFHDISLESSLVSYQSSRDVSLQSSFVSCPCLSSRDVSLQSSFVSCHCQSSRDISLQSSFVCCHCQSSRDVSLESFVSCRSQSSRDVSLQSSFVSCRSQSSRDVSLQSSFVSCPSQSSRDVSLQSSFVSCPSQSSRDVSLQSSFVSCPSQSSRDVNFKLSLGGNQSLISQDSSSNFSLEDGLKVASNMSQINPPFPDLLFGLIPDGDKPKNVSIVGTYIKCDLMPD